MPYLSKRERVKSDNRFAHQTYIGVGSVSLLIGPSELPQKSVQFFAATIEVINRVITSEFFDAPISALWFQRTQVPSRGAACVVVDAVERRGQRQRLAIDLC